MKNNTSSSRSSGALNFAIFIVITAGVMYAQELVTQILIALFIGVICAQPIAWLQKKKVPKGIAIALVFISIIAVFIGFGDLIGTSLSSFSEDSQKYEQNLKEMGASVQQYATQKGIKIPQGEVMNVFDASKVMGLTANVLGQFGGFMGNAFTIFFLVLFLLMESDSFSIKTRAILTSSTNSLDFLQTIGASIRHYLSIKTMTSLFTGILIWISLAILGVDYAIIWALIAFLLNYIPNFGSIIAAVPAVLFSVIQLGFSGGAWTAGIFITVNMIIGNIIEPKLMGKGMGLSTFVVFLSLLLWGFILGTIGMFLSVPLTMAIKIILEQNPKTAGVAIFLGTEEEAQAIIEQNN